MIKLIAVDIDDTLLSSYHQITLGTKKALNKALDSGIKVVLCSGRPLAGVSRYLDQLGISGDEQYVITNNGALVETVSGKIMSRSTLNNAEYRELADFATSHRMPYYVLDNDSNVYTSNQDINRMVVKQAWENQAGIFVRTPDQLPADFEITKAAIIGEKSDLDKYEPTVNKVLAEKFYVVRAGDNFIEIMHQNVNKGKGLKQLSQALNINSDEVMAFGDEKNDLPMLDFAKHAIAMGNGSDLAKSHANYVTDTNDNDGIAKALNKLVFN
ncbi:Cof-type HAD-IIB family hydrolase [Companilactobacillus halodurans]|uniref:HAD family phosphatase n=1 Tax=Companilactobacillus halodurans TaxID=2584183 RepID=A0A5P0ZZU1_9LACO|nr:Cof-type HAD-IIB family hydrolase [Companilactobacillus halodurans]MQS98579.1 HAD family phosphatase [Companilactobacillus halodurans]